jgi:modulator of FtsH protease HflK
MSHKYDEPQFEQRLGQILQQAEDWFRRNLQGGHLTRILPLVLGAILLLWLATGVYIVDPGHTGVVRTFGKETKRTYPGLNYRYPWPFQRVNVVSVEEVRRIEVGARAGQRVAEEALMLTNDENIIDAQLVVQYRVADPSNYLFRLRDPEGTLHSATEVALRSVVGNMKIDEVMIEKRAEVQTDTHVIIQQLMDDYQSGLIITEVRLQTADPPDAVRDAFHDVVRAREDKERLINEALGYTADILPRARGEVERLLRGAEAYRDERRLLAQGEAARFLSVLTEYREARDVTRDRLHLETIERILPHMEKFIMGGEVSQRMLPILPITGDGAAMLRQQPAPPTTATASGPTSAQTTTRTGPLPVFR